jgi:hypothetical protein
MLPKHEQHALLEARFEVMRQLPDRQQSFHYRIKDTVTGQERAVTEELLRGASPFSSLGVDAPHDRAQTHAPDAVSAQQDDLALLEPRSGSEQANGLDDIRHESPTPNDIKLGLPRAARAAIARGR